jgi:pyruvate dehydrogenase E2 component (dihydrolipoamide acetyltransferase)
MPSVDSAMKKGRVTRWLRREGEFVQAGDLIAEIATDDATMDVEAPETGLLARIIVAEGGDAVPVGAEIGVIEPGRPHHVAPHPVSSPLASGLRFEAGRSASPRARRLAREHGLDLKAIPGSGPDGRVIERDLRAALLPVDAVEPLRLPLALPLALDLAPDRQGRQLRAPMVAALQWAPHAHLEADCLVDALEGLRQQAEAAAERRISLVDCAVRALAMALQAEPSANVSYASEGFAQNLSSDVAVALLIDGGMVAPALFGAERLSLARIAEARAGFSEESLTPETCFGGSALVANPGLWGVKRMLPVITPPWTVILALGAAEPRVVVREGAAAVALVMCVTLTIDRRAMDEAAGAALLGAFKALIETPYRLVI